MKKAIKIQQSMVVLRERMKSINVKTLRHVIALKGYSNDGKTSVLKCLIAELYRRNPHGWVGNKAFDPDRVDLTQKTTEYRAVFKYKGVLIAIRTAGDTTDIMLRNFKYFDRRKVTIGITAVRIHSQGKSDVVAEHAYSTINSMRAFESHEIFISGKRLRTRDEEMKVVEKIIAELDKIVVANSSDYRNGHD